jgi:ABC-type thiamine transport system ATPase subunit
MQIRNVQIQRFRGIKSLDWCVDGQIICLIGPGDSTKSTILSAIDYALSPRWRIDFNDSDFHGGDASAPFVITVTVGGLPDEFKSDTKFGLYLRGWTNGRIHDEPEEDDELVLSVQLSVDKSLEPKWTVINDRAPDGKPISANDRDSFGIVWIGEFMDRHLTWMRGSVLSRLTGKSEELTSLLAEISRAARSSISSDKLPKLTAATQQLAKLSRAVGVQPKDIFRPHLDIKSVDVNAGALSLHDGDIPIRLSGSGTRKLITLALQKEIVSGGSVALIDEVEIGLEPHRLRRLIRSLREDSAGPLGQIFMTTHSSVVVDELPCTELRVVRVRDGDVTVQAIDEKSQKTVRRSPEVFLSSAIVVCEGITEVGFCKALDAWWLKSENYDPLAVKGISLVDGNGVAAKPYAKAMAGIGYTTAFFADSDRPLNPSRVVLEASGVTVILWGDSLCLEQRVAADLPWDGVQQLLTLAATFATEEGILLVELWFPVVLEDSAECKLTGPEFH